MAKGCPICGKPPQPNFSPFCSRLCANKDLINWMDGRYAVPVVENDPDEEIGDSDTDITKI